MDARREYSSPFRNQRDRRKSHLSDVSKKERNDNDNDNDTQRSPPNNRRCVSEGVITPRKRVC